MSRKRTPVGDRIRAKLVEEDSGYKSPCLIYHGTISAGGYGMVHVKRTPEGKQITGYIHRVLWEEFWGVPIPDDLQINHRCRQPACGELSHLELTTPQGNVLDSPYTIASINAAKTHCPQGHAYAEHARVNARGYRVCALCARIRARDAKRAREGIPPGRWRV